MEIKSLCKQGQTLQGECSINECEEKPACTHVGPWPHPGRASALLGGLNLSSSFSLVWEPCSPVFSFASEEEEPVGLGDAPGRGGRVYRLCWQGSVPGVGGEDGRVPSPPPHLSQVSVSGSCSRPARLISVQLTPKGKVMRVRTCGKGQPPTRQLPPPPSPAASASSDQQRGTSSTECTAAALRVCEFWVWAPDVGDGGHRESLRPGSPGTTRK